MFKVVGITTVLALVVGYGLSYVLGFLGIASIAALVISGTFLGLAIGMFYTLPAWNAALITQVKGVTSKVG